MAATEPKDHDHQQLVHEVIDGDTEIVTVHEDIKSEVEKAINNSVIKDNEIENNSNVETEIAACHDITQLYYILHNHRINGPYTVHEIGSLYVCKQIKAAETLYISSADGDSDWIELVIPDSRVTDVYEHDEYYQQYVTKNKNIKAAYPKLYALLVEQRLNGNLMQVRPPKDIPDAEKKEISKTKFVIRRVLGKILFAILLLVILIHIAPLFIFGVIITLCVVKCNCEDDASNTQLRILSFIIYFMMFSGFIATPVVVCYLILTETDIYDEIQSWMVAYIGWGAASFILLYVFVIANVVIRDSKKQEQLMKVGTAVVFYIVGVDLGQMDIEQMIREAAIVEMLSGEDVAIIVLMMIPPCAALLPAAIAGFIANFVLEEKFELKCDDRIVNDDLCFDTSYGCCEVVSSHNISNVYVFMGGLASNILASWAVIRICGYLLVNAYSNFSVHANRRVFK